MVNAPGLGWDFIQKLAKQQFMESLHRAAEVAQGERSVMVDGNDDNAFFSAM